jgi:hypothetical protein
MALAARIDSMFRFKIFLLTDTKQEGHVGPEIAHLYIGPRG